MSNQHYNSQYQHVTPSPSPPSQASGLLRLQQQQQSKLNVTTPQSPPHYNTGLPSPRAEMDMSPLSIDTSASTLRQSSPQGASTSSHPSLPTHHQPSPPSPFPPQHPHQHTSTQNSPGANSVGACLGQGGFGMVHAATRISDGVEVAVKFILREKVPRTNWVRDDVAIVPMEVYILRRIRHENIIRFVDYFDGALHGGQWSASNTSSATPSLTTDSTPSSPFTSSPLTAQRRSSCDLFECIELMERFTEEQAKHVFRQIASAVAYLTSIGIVHRDIKDENILIDDSFNVKLIDFGSASFVTHNDGLFLGTLQYASPEIFEGHRRLGPECEVWSLGCCLYIMLTGEVPFPTPQDVRFSRPQPLRPNVGPLSMQCSDLLARMLDKDMRRRATMAEILSHPWFA
ncbi:kinase-like domain-containing protein [Chytridium lagenaria]|nr:kinase-like domain-containing protein [Chytridium lagenaria]